MKPSSTKQVYLSKKWILEPAKNMVHLIPTPTPSYPATYTHAMRINFNNQGEEKGQTDITWGLIW